MEGGRGMWLRLARALDYLALGRATAALGPEIYMGRAINNNNSSTNPASPSSSSWERKGLLHASLSLSFPLSLSLIVCAIRIVSPGPWR